MKIHEFQAKAIFKDYGIPIPEGIVADTAEKVLEAGKELRPGKLAVSSKAYDRAVAGIISGAGGVQPGIRMTQHDAFETGQLVALSGQAYALATAVNGAIEPGDLLTTSDIAGHAMRATERDRTPGTVIGKAMSPLREGEGLVLVLVNLQ